MKRFLNTPAASIKWSLRSEDGYVLPTVLIILALIFGVSTLLLGQIHSDVAVKSKYLDYEHCLFTAKTAMAQCQGELAADPAYTGTSQQVTLSDGGSYMITVKKTSETLRFVEITAFYKAYTKKYNGSAEIENGTGKLLSFSVKLVT